MLTFFIFYLYILNTNTSANYKNLVNTISILISIYNASIDFYTNIILLK